MGLELLKTGDKRLKEKAIEVTDFTKDYMSLIEEIKQMCLEGNAYAAAAPQFGIKECFIVILTVDEITELDPRNRKYILEVYFNPVIIRMEGKQSYYEACMSVENTVGLVERPFYIKFDYQDIKGDKHQKEVEGFEAIVLCHEIDHLNGVEFTDRAKIIYKDVDVGKRINIRKKYPHTIMDTSGLFKYEKKKQTINTYNEDDFV
jgi:peptide deformylase